MKAPFRSLNKKGREAISSQEKSLQGDSITLNAPGPSLKHHFMESLKDPFAFKLIKC